MRYAASLPLGLTKTVEDYDWSQHVPGHHEIETASGRYVDLEHPQAWTITLEDVAAGLSNTCRYNGQVEFYSVGQHAVIVARRLERLFPDQPDMWLAGLHHDDAEAFLGDVTRPLKSLLQPIYGILSDRMDEAIVEALNLPWSGDALGIPEIKDADNWALMLEAQHLLPSKGKLWGGQAHNWDVDMEASSDDYDLWTGCWAAYVARAAWLAQHYYIVDHL